MCPILSYRRVYNQVFDKNGGKNDLQGNDRTGNGLESS